MKYIYKCSIILKKDLVHAKSRGSAPNFFSGDSKPLEYSLRGHSDVIYNGLCYDDVNKEVYFAGNTEGLVIDI